jgi:hypothetical protein
MISHRLDVALDIGLGERQRRRADVAALDFRGQLVAPNLTVHWPADWADAFAAQASAAAATSVFTTLFIRTFIISPDSF